MVITHSMLKKTKRPKLAKIPPLKKKVWKILSMYARLRDTDSDGYGNCCTCGKRMHFKEGHGGHYIAKSLGLKVYFEEKNVHLQCPGCNLFKHGNLHEYAIFLEDKYGKGILQELNKLRHEKPMGAADSRMFLEDCMVYYKAKLNVQKLRHLL